MMIPLVWLDALILATGAAVVISSIYLLLRWRDLNEVRVPFVSTRPHLAWAKLGIWVGLLGSVCLVSSVFDPAHSAFNAVPLTWALGLVLRTLAIFILFASIDHLLAERGRHAMG